MRPFILNASVYPAAARLAGGDLRERVCHVRRYQGKLPALEEGSYLLLLSSLELSETKVYEP